jgi:uncharacterized protein
MISTAELHQLADREGLRFDQTEKDYVILWILKSLSQERDVAESWSFKGGTCLRHCYYPGYRFSEDIDFSCKSGSSNIQRAHELLERVARTVEQGSGIRVNVKVPHDLDNDAQVEIGLEYSRGGPRRQALPAVKVHLTFDEPVLIPCEDRLVQPSYPDLAPFRIQTYAKIEIVAEKMRALLQQQDRWPRPRDLYDLWCIHCRYGEQFPADKLIDLFRQKCAVRGVAPEPEKLISQDLHEWNIRAWQNQLVPMLKDPPEYERVWTDWRFVCTTLFPPEPQ